MGVKLQKPKTHLEQILKEYTIIQKLPLFNITFIQESNSQNRQQLILKQYPFDTYTEAYQFSLKLEHISHIYSKCEYLIHLQKHFLTNDHTQRLTLLCALYKYPHRTLDHERLERHNKNIRFNQNQIWSILTSCVSALNQLQKQGSRHLNISTSTIALDDLGVIKLYDPSLIKNFPNYIQIREKTHLKNVYICPELCNSLKFNQKLPKTDPYLSDIFVVGMVILEIGLMQYLSECYTEKFDHLYEDVLEQKILQFQQLYSQVLSGVVREMLRPLALRSSYRKILNLIKKYQPAGSRFSSYQELQRPSMRVSHEVSQSEKDSFQARSERGVFEIPAIRGMSFANSEAQKVQNIKRSRSNHKQEKKEGGYKQQKI